MKTESELKAIAQVRWLLWYVGDRNRSQTGELEIDSWTEELAEEFALGLCQDRSDLTFVVKDATPRENSEKMSHDETLSIFSAIGQDIIFITDKINSCKNSSEDWSEGVTFWTNRLNELNKAKEKLIKGCPLDQLCLNRVSDF